MTFPETFPDKNILGVSKIAYILLKIDEIHKNHISINKNPNMSQ